MQAARAGLAIRVWRVRVTLSPWLVVGLCVLAGLAGCGGDGGSGGAGGGTTPPPTTQSGRVTVTISDPPTCKAPRGDLNRVWVTITLVRAHLSSAAPPDDSGWVTLLDLRANPVQIDLLATSDTTCILTTLGSTTGLPPGDYQQIRLHLLSNTPATSEVTPSPNNCAGPGGPGGFNCVELNGTRRALLLSSEARTGIKIPPGQIAGGAIRLRSDQAADINIDFNACASIVQQGNGAFRLKPTLHAGEVSTTQAISGRVVDNSTGQPILNATIIVMAEQLDGGIDRVILQTLASATDGTFILCPLPTGNYDIVIAARSGAGVTYNATITFGVPAGTAMGAVPLVPEVGSTSPGTIDGLVTTTANGVATGADVALSALQTATPAGGTPVPVTIPLFRGSTPNVATESGSGCPQGTGCANYMLSVPASNPMVGTFSPSGTAYALPASGSVAYSVNAQAFVPGTAGETPDCSPSSLLIGPVTVSAGTITPVPLAFTGCAAGF